VVMWWCGSKIKLVKETTGKIGRPKLEV
jgi:hypothetical protein